MVNGISGEIANPFQVRSEFIEGIGGTEESEWLSASDYERYIALERQTYHVPL